MKKTLKKLIAHVSTFALAILNSMAAEAYILAKRGAEPIDFKAPTTLLIAGRGKDLGRQFQESALSQAQRYSEVVPGRQVVLVFARESKSAADFRYVEARGFRVVESNNAVFTSKALFGVLERFSAIVSLHVFSHHGAHVGAGLEGGPHRFHWNTPGVNKLKNNFTEGAFVVFHGCNSGFYTAPRLAKAWKIPVFGSFTSTDFQQLHVDGRYYFNNPGQAPAGGWTKARVSALTGETLNCTLGYCKRMKADNMAYKGIWGSFAGGGLPFLKAFCPWGEDAKCLRGMAAYVLSFLSPYELTTASPLRDYAMTVKDLMCPNDVRGVRREECFAALDDSSRTTYTPFMSPTLQCDMAGCSFEFRCAFDANGRPREGTCSLRNTNPNRHATTFVDEYRRFLRAHEYLQTIHGGGVPLLRPANPFLGTEIEN